MADLEPPRPVISGTLAVFDQETCDPNEWENFKRSIRPSFQNRRPRTAADNPGVVVAEDGAVFLEARGIGGNLAQLRMVFPIAGGQQFHAVLPQQTRLGGGRLQNCRHVLHTEPLPKRHQRGGSERTWTVSFRPNEESPISIFAL